MGYNLIRFNAGLLQRVDSGGILAIPSDCRRTDFVLFRQAFVGFLLVIILITSRFNRVLIPFKPSNFLPVIPFPAKIAGLVGFTRTRSKKSG